RRDGREEPQGNAAARGGVSPARGAGSHGSARRAAAEAARAQGRAGAAAARRRRGARARPASARGKGGLMEVLLLGIYSFFVWLIFIKLKWLPWNIGSQVTVVIIPVVGLAALILLLNIFAPSSSDLRVYKYTVPIVSQVRGRVVEVPVEEGNRLVHKGDVLFRIDPTPYELEVKTLEAQLVGMQGSKGELEEQAKGAQAKIEESQNRARE